ncbi:hypothetical protein [Lentzea flava]|uniref:hypothetical protein n=1 Tax=Lentzea flava TaxID=103732 RepID=UPI0016706BF4|nr:hypothetical protein [Lentzea flava]
MPISAANLPVARKGYRDVLSKAGDESHYLRRAKAVNDFHGLGAFLVRNEEFRS